MTLILGIDPGSRITGYGVVRDTGRGCVYVASGCIRTGSGEQTISGPADTRVAVLNAMGSDERSAT